MSTGVIGSAVLLVLAAVLVGLLVQLVRQRSRPDPAEPPQTVGELVKQRTPTSGEHPDEGLPTPAGSPVVGAAEPPHGTSGDATAAVSRGASGGVGGLPATPPPDGEFGDAPWRRAARMMGAEPGGGWDTAPLPLAAVPAASAEPSAGVTQPTRRPDAERTAALPPPAAEPAEPKPSAKQSGGTQSGGTQSGGTQSGGTQSGAAQAGSPAPERHTAVQAEPTVAGSSARPVPGDRSDGPVGDPAPQPVAAAPAVSPAVPPGAPPAAHPIARPDAQPIARPDAQSGGRAGAHPGAQPIARPGAQPTARPTVPEPPADEPVVRCGSSARPVAAATSAAPPSPAAPARDGSAGPDGPSRPLSDPDLTPLMGIPVVRPLSADAAVRPSPRPARPAGGPSPDAGVNDAAVDDAAVHGAAVDGATGDAAVDCAAANDVPASERPTVPVPLGVLPGAAAPAGPVPPAPVLPDPVLVDPTPTDPPRVVPPAWASDDDVALLLPVTVAAPPPVVRTGSPQPVLFRVVRRDGEPVTGALVTLLDDHGQEVDATKTATDGGGELAAPHSGRFLMIAGSDGFQPRAALLTVEDRPVELALLLPRSACVAGVVRSGQGPVTGARVVARQEGEIVDDLVTGRDGAYRFTDLAEGPYAVSATDHRGSVVHPVTLSEGADVHLDLDLVYRNGGR